MYAIRSYYVFIDDDYKGVYVLLEQIKQDDNRVDIAKLKPEDIAGDELTGGYIFRVDKTSDMSTSEYWTSTISSPFNGDQIVFQYYDPKYEDLASQQASYLKTHLREVEIMLKDALFRITSYNVCYTKLLRS